jgi:Acetyltransferase (isoleucine patch superfamily)
MKSLLIKIFRTLRAWEISDRYKKLRKKYSIPDSFRFNGSNIAFYGPGELVIGEDSYVGENSTIQISQGTKVVIGNKCRISHNVRMYTSSANPNLDFRFASPKDKKNGDIIIMDYVWIGANVFINPGVTIGENSVVGANAVVTKDVEPFSIYGGVPAQLIKRKALND